MGHYLKEMDRGLKFLLAEHKESDIRYINGEVYFSKQIEFEKNSDIIFCCSFFAVKVYKTTIILQDKNKIKAYFTDVDMKNILTMLKESHVELYNYLRECSEKIAYKKHINDISFCLNEKKFIINGIPFNSIYNDVFCENPADILLTGNDLIGLLSLIFEKELFDKNPEKVINTYKFYF